LILEELSKECSNCTKCDLSNGRTNVVFGRGNESAELLFIGEGPGEQEDLQGLPFVGPAGKLLDLLFRAQDIKPEEYYIANIVKCRPPNNRVPTDDEANECMIYLRKQVSIIKPRLIVCLGATAMKYIIDKDAKISQIRGQWVERKGCSIMPTFHPAALLRDSSKKPLMWDDIKKVKKRLDEVVKTREA
jgi:uracil-DNA glycosylase, family 4